jgi:DNA-binding NarL/FixJ family response regulator
MLQQLPDVMVVGEAADGLDAIAQAAELQPDVVLLDISLPSLNGIEVAGHLRATAPHARIVLVTSECSSDVIEEAFRRGAHGYVYKPRVLRDLLQVIDAIEHGGRIVAGSLDRIARGDGFAAHRHPMLFWSSDAVMIDGFSRFIARALADDAAVLVVATPPHQDAITRHLTRSNVDVVRAIRQGRCCFVDSDELLSNVIVGGWPDETRLFQLADETIRKLARGASGERRVVACGEGAAMLWARGAIDATIELERLWDVIASRYQVDTLCPYPAAALRENTQAVRRLCAEHTVVEIR